MNLMAIEFLHLEICAASVMQVAALGAALAIYKHGTKNCALKLNKPENFSQCNKGQGGLIM